MAVLVTGGAGFIGSHLVDRLIANDNVIVFDNLITGSIANLERSLSSRRAIFAYTDVARDIDQLDDLYRETTPEPLTAIYHLASPESSHAFAEHPWQTLATNSYGTMQLLELARRHKAAFIFASSSDVYGDPLVHPQFESYTGNVDPVGRRSCYTEAKRFGEAVVTTAAYAHRVDARIVRIFTCYGPRMPMGDGRLVPALLTAARAGEPFPIHGDGMQTRSLTFVNDIIDGLLCIANAPGSARPINLGSDEERTVVDIVQTFARVARLPFVPAFVSERREAPYRSCPAIDIARGLGWSPRIKLDEGLWETLAWYRLQLYKYASA